MNRIESFTEYALFNRWALDLLSPTDFQKYRIPYAESLLQSLDQAPKNPYLGKENRSYWCKLDQYFLLTPLKIAYIATVTLTFSRLGVIANGCLTVYSYIKYTLSSRKDVEFQKTLNYAQAFFADLTSAVLGALFTKILVESSFYALHFSKLSSIMGKSHSPLARSIIYSGISLTGMLIGSSGFFLFQSPQTVPEIFARSQDRVGMYMSLLFRKHLGLVGLDGKLLHFSKSDQLNYVEDSGKVSFEGSNYSQLCSFIANAEYELIATVVKCNKHLLSGQKINYIYPFNGETIACSLSKSTSKTPLGNNRHVVAIHNDLQKLIVTLRTLQIKINVLKKIRYTAIKLTYNDSFVWAYIKGAFKTPYKELRLGKDRISFIKEEDYKNYYQRCGSATKYDIDNGTPWANIKVEEMDPNRQQRPSNEDLFEQFKYDVGVCKWLANQGQPTTPIKQLLGLKEPYNYQEYSAQKRRYQLAFHPDKHIEQAKKDCAEELFKIIQSIFEKLDEEMKP